MMHPDYLRLKARELRLERRLSLDEIVERLGLPKTTVFEWIRDIPLQRARRVTEAQERAWEANRERHRLRREDTYAQGVEEYGSLIEVTTFRDFVALYVAEGYKRSRNTVQICNSDPLVMTLAVRWLRRLTDRTLHFSVQHHVDQDLDELRAFWSGLLGFDPAELTVRGKSNSGELRGRTWRSVHSVLSVRVYDTALRSRLEAWIDLTKASWQ